MKNIKHAIALAMKGDTLGASLCEDYCLAGNKATKAYVCVPLIIHPEFYDLMGCCVKHLDLAIEKARQLGTPEGVIMRARRIIAEKLGEPE